MYRRVKPAWREWLPGAFSLPRGGINAGRPVRARARHYAGRSGAGAAAVLVVVAARGWLHEGAGCTTLLMAVSSVGGLCGASGVDGGGELAQIRCMMAPGGAGCVRHRPAAGTVLWAVVAGGDGGRGLCSGHGRHNGGPRSFGGCMRLLGEA